MFGVNEVDVNLSLSALKRKDVNCKHHMVGSLRKAPVYLYFVFVERLKQMCEHKSASGGQIRVCEELNSVSTQHPINYLHVVF